MLMNSKVKFIETNISKEKRIKEIDNITVDNGNMYFNLSYFQSDQSSIFLFNILLIQKNDLCFSKYDGK
jgi:hypothetical protein